MLLVGRQEGHLACKTRTVKCRKQSSQITSVCQEYICWAACCIIKNAVWHAAGSHTSPVSICCCCSNSSSNSISYVVSSVSCWCLSHLSCLSYLYNKGTVPSVLWCCWLGGRKGIQPVKNWVLGCWHGYLSGARCRLAYCPADATATHCLLLL